MLKDRDGDPITTYQFAAGTFVYFTLPLLHKLPLYRMTNTRTGEVTQPLTWKQAVHYKGALDRKLKREKRS